MSEHLKNYGIMMPQSFVSTFIGCNVSVHFEYKNKWEEFKGWVAEGNLEQLQWRGKEFDMWVKIFDNYPTSPMSLQQHFNNYCEPKIEQYGYDSFTIPIK